ncbi:transcriptional regulator with XRE-family HTH domain [Pseudomonas frederiksbergensis]
MVTRQSLAAVLRVARSIAGSSREDLASQIHPTYLHDLENAKSGATLEKLGGVASALGCDPLALLLIASARDMQINDASRLQMLADEIDRLTDLGLLNRLEAQLEGGSLKSQRSGRSLSEDKLQAVLQCREKGLTQKETANVTGVSPSTVHRIWKRESTHE